MFKNYKNYAFYISLVTLIVSILSLVISYNAYNLSCHTYKLSKVNYPLDTNISICPEGESRTKIRLNFEVNQGSINTFYFTNLYGNRVNSINIDKKKTTYPIKTNEDLYHYCCVQKIGESDNISNNIFRYIKRDNMNVFSCFIVAKDFKSNTNKY